MLEDDCVAQQQVRRRKTGDLVVGEVPRHDAQKRAQWFLADDGQLGTLGGQVFIGEELVGVLGVPAVDIGNDVDFRLGPPSQLPHFAPNVLGQFSLAFGVQVSSPGEDFCAFLDRGLAPAFVSGGGAIEDVIARRILDAVEAVFGLSCAWVLNRKCGHVALYSPGRSGLATVCRAKAHT